MKTSFSAIVFGFCLIPAVASGQFKEQSDPKAPKLTPGLTQRLVAGVSVKAVGGSCKGIMATVPLPVEWPEQQVKIVNEELSPTVKKLQYRTIGGSLQQMLVEVPLLPSGQEAKAMLTFELYRSTIQAPADTKIYSIPKKIDRELLVYTGTSPFIEARHPKFLSTAREITAGKEDAWSQVEALYDWTRDNIEKKNGPLKGAIRALNDKEGDIDEIVSVFIALCRAHKVPARTVFVPGFCYAEFYLVDDDGRGHWFPCQPSGERAFGSSTEQRPILQKGDNFRDAERPRESMRYVSEFLSGAGSKGGGQPKVKFVRDIAGGGAVAMP